MEHEPQWVNGTTGVLGKAIQYACDVPYCDVGQVVKDWPAHWHKVRLWQTLRADGGNLGLNVNDDRDAVLARRNALADAWEAPLVWLNQVHEKTVFCVDAHKTLPVLDAELPWATADAAVYTQNKMGLTVLTADCLPVVLVAFACGFDGLQPKAVGIAHAGWRGLAAGILKNTVAALHDVVINTKNEPIRIEAWLGPAIGPLAFEVGSEVRAAFLHVLGCDAAHAFTECGAEKWLCNLHELAQMSLRKLGVECIAGNAKMGHCTVHEPYWFSHRRALQRNEVQGRMATIVGLVG